MSHLDNLKIYFPDLFERTILDVGAGRGSGGGASLYYRKKKIITRVN